MRVSLFRRIIFPICIFLIAISTQAMTLEDFLSTVREKHGFSKSFRASMEASELRGDQSDLDFSPVLTMSGSYLDDRKTNGTPPSILIPHQQIRDYSLGVSKKFLSGTKAQFGAGTTLINQDMYLLSTGANSAYQFGMASLSIGFEQSLWRDAFGHASRLRLERERLQESAEKNTYNLQLQQLLVDAEAAFWDVIYLRDEIQLRRESLERASKIESWVRRRFSNGIGDQADVLNAEGLVAVREMQLLSTQDELKAAEKKLMEFGEWSVLPELKAELGVARSLYQSSVKQRRVRLDSYLAILEARSKKIAALEVEDSLRPDLVLQANYKTNALEDSIPNAMGKWTSTDKPTAGVGLKLTWLLDFEMTEKAKHAAQMDATASRFRSERKLLESESAWAELQRRYEEMSKKIKAAEKISQIQVSKAKVERTKLANGRTVTSEVITAEQEAADAELNLVKLKAEQRKMESLSRMFVVLPENEGTSL